MNQNVRELISAIEDDIYSNKYYYNKMHSNLETKSRLENILRKQKKKWKSETLKYIPKIHLMKEKKEDMYQKNVNKLQKEINPKEKEKKQSLEIFLRKESNVKEIYNKKLRKEEKQRKDIKNKLEKCKSTLYIYYFFSWKFGLYT